MKTHLVFSTYSDLLRDLGIRLDAAMHILDFGCGEGALVRQGRQAGFQVFGCDFAPPPREYLSAIEDPYRLPYRDSFFDVEISNQVFEHVMDYDQALAELARVLKPRGVYLHIFPPRWTPIEPHVCVPFGTVIRRRPWLAVWAFAGIRNLYQRGASAAEVVARNHAYLVGHTNYLPKRRIAEHFHRHFADVRFVESVYLRHSPNRVLRLAGRLPFVPTLYGACRGRVVFGGHTVEVSGQRARYNRPTSRRTRAG
jgi:SAM-dependent methyltransferase